MLPELDQQNPHPDSFNEEQHDAFMRWLNKATIMICVVSIVGILCTGMLLSAFVYSLLIH